MKLAKLLKSLLYNNNKKPNDLRISRHRNKNRIRFFFFGGGGEGNEKLMALFGKIYLVLGVRKLVSITFFFVLRSVSFK